MSDDQDRVFMRLALSESLKCPMSAGAFSVGAVLVLKGRVLSTGYSRERAHCHAEQVCLLKHPRAHGCTIYSTMEPCGRRLSGAVCCAQLLINARVTRVVHALREPPTFVQPQGQEMLRAAGITVDYLAGLSQECLGPNSHLV